MRDKTPIPLCELDGELGTIKLSEGGELSCLWFQCPACKVNDPPAHFCLMAFTDEGGPRTSAGPTWKKVSGTTVDDITLSPSFLVRAPCNLHGWVRDGKWVWC